jgi:hypothetical protein
MSCRKIAGVFQSIISLMILFFILKLDYMNCNCEKTTSKYLTIVLSLLVLLSGLLLIFENKQEINMGSNFIIVLCLILSLLSYLVTLKKTLCKCIRLNDKLYNILKNITTPVDKFAKFFMYFIIISLILGLFIFISGYRFKCHIINRYQ